MTHLPLTRAINRSTKNLLKTIPRRTYATDSPQLISPTKEISVPADRTAYEFKALNEPDPQLDGLGYPRVESLSRQWRNPYAKWDDPQERVNFDEPLHAEEEMMGMWAPDVHRISVSTALKGMAVAFSGVGAILLAAGYMAPSSPVVPRTFPYDGLSRELGGPGQGVKRNSRSEEESD
ncbi:hypothetical protein MJO29_014927 [Puccinia striiformis f. sp. tritici]|nr:hypothetical protein Pst134EA_027994 [Puccinia striiformis f. sp. tritici]KAH9448700.1 hypothetical protein Pst134EA_027994 [Puccinia striiformis f. sp. tritici]KAI7937612.1 hypothetical protein MJO29_014927 [Puccinia striiformis f. sp. tritici]KAI9624842.1 hypothetical protein H4Q26_016617 [Puccinia striiformis f. sp. tritici PST-130]KNF03327.1 hypothetical protein PSTG_03595 [Puccinia striiformis f. sp. tritici PST-78]